MNNQLYIENQRQLLCGLHALNHLFQDNVFTRRYMDALALECEMDKRAFLGGYDTGDRHFDPRSGDYSVEVMKKALKIANMEMVSLGDKSDPRAREIVRRSRFQQAFIVIKNAHWYTLRKFGGVWYEINSVPSEHIVPLEVIGDQIEMFSSEAKRREFSGIYAIMM